MEQKIFMNSRQEERGPADRVVQGGRAPGAAGLVRSARNAVLSSPGVFSGMAQQAPWTQFRGCYRHIHRAGQPPRHPVVTHKRQHPALSSPLVYFQAPWPCPLISQKWGRTQWPCASGACHLAHCSGDLPALRRASARSKRASRAPRDDTVRDSTAGAKRRQVHF